MAVTDLVSCIVLTANNDSVPAGRAGTVSSILVVFTGGGSASLSTGQGVSSTIFSTGVVGAGDPQAVSVHGLAIPAANITLSLTGTGVVYLYLSGC